MVVPGDKHPLQTPAVAAGDKHQLQTPAASPDLNNIKLICHSPKDYLRIEYKPRNLTQLKAGVCTLFATNNPEDVQ